MVAGQYLTYREAGTELGLSADRVKHLVSEGSLHSVKSKEVGRKGVTKYISDKELEAYKQRKLTRPVVSVSNEQTTVSASNTSFGEYTEKVSPVVMQAIEANRQVAAQIAEKNEQIVQSFATEARVAFVESSRGRLLAWAQQWLIDRGVPEDIAKDAANKGGNMALDVAHGDISTEAALGDLTKGIDAEDAARLEKAAIDFIEATQGPQRVILTEPQPA